MHLVPGRGRSTTPLPEKAAALETAAAAPPDALLAVPFVLRIRHGKAEPLFIAGGLAALLGTLPGAHWLTPWLHPRDAVTALPDYAALAAAPEVVQLFRILQPRGDYRWLQQTCRLQLAESAAGSPNFHNSPDDYRIEGLLVDGARQQERAEAELRYRNFSELAGDWYWEQDENFCFTYFSKEFAEITGVSLPLTLGKPRWASVGSLDTSGIDWAGHIRTHEAHLPFRNFEYPSRVGNRPLWIRASGRPKFDEDGRFAGYVGVASEIGAYKQAEEAAIRAGIERDVSRAGLAQVLGGSSVATFVIDRDHRVAYWNRACENLTGVSAAAVVGTNEQWRPFYSSARPVMADLILSGESESKIRQHYPGKWRRSKLIENAYEAEDFFPRFGSDGRWVFFTAAPLRDESGQVVGAIETLQDVTRRKLAEAQLRIAAIVFEAQEGMIITDAGGVMLSVNSAFTRITGYTAAEAVGQTMRLLHSGRHQPGFYTAMWEIIARSGSWQGEVWDRRKNGEVYPEWLSITAVKGEAGEVTHYVGTFTDITDKKIAEDEIRHLAFYDALTDLPNRMLLNDRLQQALVAARRDDARIALMFLDLDKFKPINDNYGHDVGDQLLKDAARRILACVRESDTVARIGGDEFIVLLRTVEDTRDALAVAEKIRVALSQPFALKGHRLEVSSSIGLALYPAHGNDAFALSKNADIAMYQAKSAGRNAVRIFSPDALAEVAEECAGSSKGIVRLVWRAAYNSGNPVIDHEHRELFRLANVLLEKTGAQREAPLEFDAAFDALLRHLVEHFAHEESILASHGYAHLAEHAAQHQALVESAIKLSEQASESIVSMGELVEFLVAEVVAGHLLKKDRTFFGLFAEPVAGS
jgi:diguanylate cyclase (GGDEF)-like protein/hemerythrin-like metal-binding protein/PAS domain S-box-containing protein